MGYPQNESPLFDFKDLFFYSPELLKGFYNQLFYLRFQTFWLNGKKELFNHIIS